MNKLKTTAIYPNRIRDKNDVEVNLCLSEFGDEKTEFRTKNGTLFAKGYVRIVYGDHGPYVEFEKYHIDFSIFKLHKKSNRAWYDEWYLEDIMLYDQKKDVSMLPNPPRGKKSFRGNRKEGYADYRVGKIYLDPFSVLNSRGLKNKDRKLLF